MWYTDEASPDATMLEEKLSKREVDSVVVNRAQTSRYREFVVQDIGQVFPEYIVTYERLGAQRHSDRAAG